MHFVVVLRLSLVVGHRRSPQEINHDGVRAPPHQLNQVVDVMPAALLRPAESPSWWRDTWGWQRFNESQSEVSWLSVWIVDTRHALRGHLSSRRKPDS